jgi:hypothetical protein
MLRRCAPAVLSAICATSIPPWRRACGCPKPRPAPIWKDAERSGGLVVFGFHGVGGDYLTTSAAAHAELVAYLKAHSETLWVAPFSTVMDAVMRKKK